MRVVIQRVKSALCTVSQKMISKIDSGYMILIGISKDDTKKEAEFLANKIKKLRVFEDENEKMNLSIDDIEGEILAISQFTLYADTTTGNRPSFTKAMDYKSAETVYDHFCEYLNNVLNVPTKKGEFGAMMDISLVNSGPVTILIDTNDFKV